MERARAGWPLSGEMRRAGAEVTEKVKWKDSFNSQGCWCLRDCGDHSNIMAEQTAKGGSFGLRFIGRVARVDGSSLHLEHALDRSEVVAKQ